jgi:predicted XRE-type DNA-binding protein
MKDCKITKSSGNVFLDIGFSAEEAQNLMLRAQTMFAIAEWYAASGMTQKEAAKALGVTQPRLNQLLKNKIELFSLDALVSMATRAGMRVGLTIKPVAGVKVRVAKTEKPKKPARVRAAA